LASILGPALLFGAMAWWTWDRVQRDTTLAINRKVDMLTEDARRLLQSDAIVLARVTDRVQNLSWPEIADRQPELSRELAALVRGIGEVESVVLADETGRIRVSSPAYAVRSGGATELAGTSVADSGYFRAAQASSGLVVDGPAISPTTGRPIVTVAKRISNREGAFLGIAALNLSPANLIDFWRRLVSPGDSVSLLGEDGTVLARYPPTPAGEPAARSHFSQIAMRVIRSADAGLFDRTPSPIDGIARTLGFRRIPGYPLYIVNAIDRSNVVREWLPSALAFGVLAIGAAVALFLSAHAVIRHARREEDALRRAETSEASYRDLYARTPVPMHACDSDGNLTAVSDSWLALLGYVREEVLGRPIASFHTADSATALASELRQAIDSGTTHSSAHQLVRKSGEIVDVVIAAQFERRAAGDEQRILAFVTDVTAQRRAEEALRQAQRLEAVGQLTGGVAHDFNNLLVVVTGNAGLLRGAVHEEQHVRALDAIERASQRGARLARQLLAFSRQQLLSPSVIDLSERLPRMRELLVGTFHGDIEVILSVPPAIWPIEVDAGELELALLNIAVNARDAMPNGGRFIVSARNVTLARGSPPGELVGDFVVLTLTDTGEGIAPEYLSKVFEPYFTTKPLGQGTGLGLSQVFGFTRQSGGTVSIDTAVGLGTSINLYFPRREPQSVPEARAAAQPAATGGSETILVVEDEPEVADVSRAMLNKLGYRTRQAADARGALEVLADDPAIDLVLSDVMMPGGMSGVQLARTIRQRYPGVAVLLTSGYGGAAEEVRAVGVPSIAKPYQLDVLNERIRAALAMRGNRPGHCETPATA